MNPYTLYTRTEYQAAYETSLNARRSRSSLSSTASRNNNNNNNNKRHSNASSYQSNTTKSTFHNRHENQDDDNQSNLYYPDQNDNADKDHEDNDKIHYNQSNEYIENECDYDDYHDDEIQSTMTGATSVYEASVMEATVMPSVSIALFGAHTLSGRYFLRSALNAGYQVQALVTRKQQQLLQETMKDVCGVHGSAYQNSLHWIEGKLEETDKVRKVLKKASYVVCMLQDGLSAKSKDYSVGCLSAFVRLLYPLMKKEQSIRVFLYQATSLAPDVSGTTPVLSRLVKKGMNWVGRKYQYLQDQDAVVREVAIQHGIIKDEAYGDTTAGVGVGLGDMTDEKENATQKENTTDSLLSKKKDGTCSDTDDHTNLAKFAFILTRPSILIKDGPSNRLLAASKSQPGPIPISHADLGEFSLTALLAKKLWNSSPYIVSYGSSTVSK